jgi:solute carrier family 25 (mitochondrial carnitine/acylcarnitine transporter), member 20/29
LCFFLKSAFLKFALQLIGFYKGMSFPVLSAGIMNSLYFGVYGTSLRHMQSQLKGDADEVSEPSLTTVFLAGCLGGAAQLGVACPVDLAKIKLQIQTGNETLWNFCCCIDQ